MELKGFEPTAEWAAQSAEVHAAAIIPSAWKLIGKKLKLW
jgi:hypothetical protein